MDSLCVIDKSVLINLFLLCSLVILTINHISYNPRFITVEKKKRKNLIK